MTTARSDAVRRAVEVGTPHSSDCDEMYGHACDCDRDERLVRAVVDAVVPPGHVVINADPLAAVLDYVLDGQGDLTDVMAAAQRLATALDAWMEQP